MAYQTPKTVSEVLRSIHTREYVLPAIQREFVWRQEQISRLFDSLMRGYPIGGFLFWEVESENVEDYVYYDFVRRFHRRDRRHNPPLPSPPDGPVTAVLDGQQRLTALNIGLSGSFAEKTPWKWWRNDDAFPERFLYLNILREAPENEDGMLYEFDFLTHEEAGRRNGEDAHWFPVAMIMKFREAPEIWEYLHDHELSKSRFAFRRLNRLLDTVHRDRVIPYFLERTQEPEHVLDIFIRVNSAGTVLSKSDLLLSIATAQWREESAREVIHTLVDRLNSIGVGFAFSKDFVLKAGLLLCDLPDVGFKVTNFTRENMRTLEEGWPDVERAIELAVSLAASFGFSNRTLTADSSLLPLAYYLHRRGEDKSFLARSSAREDRALIRSWLTRSILKRGVWGAGLDTTLKAIRTAIRESEGEGFPAREIETAMARIGRSLAFSPEEVMDLLDTSRSGRQVFAVLSLLYPFVDVRNHHHIDHIFPYSRFGKRSLREMGLGDEQIEEWQAKRDRLPNLQLLEGPENQSKGDRLPHQWLEAQYPDADVQAMYRRKHDLGDLPAELGTFEEFYATRRDRMAERLMALLGRPENPELSGEQEEDMILEETP